MDDRYTLADHQARDDDPYAKAKYDLTLRWLRSVGSSGLLVNIGCGGGVFNEMAYASGYDVVGLEPDEEAFKIALAAADTKYRVSNLGLFDDLGLDRPDAIVMHDVLEHIESERAAVARLASLLSSDTVAVISVPAMQWLFGYHDRQLGHYRRYTKRTLRRALANEFEVERIRYLGVVMIPIALWYSRIRNKPYPAANQGDGITAKVLSAICKCESRIAGPVGTSVVAFVRLRKGDAVPKAGATA
jgi:SAM-dependent methyltransferase